MILSTYLDAVYNSGGVPGLPGTIDDEIEPRNMFFLERRPVYSCCVVVAAISTCYFFKPFCFFFYIIPEAPEGV